MPRVLLALIAVALALPATAQAGPLLDQTVEALESNPVFVHPDAGPTISKADAERLRDRIDTSGAGPVYIAVLPAAARNEAGGDTTEFLRLLGETMDREGTYAVVIGGQFRAASTVLERGRAASLATRAFQANSDEGIAATLLAFVDLVGAERSGAGSDEGDGGGGEALLPILAVAGAGAVGVYVVRRRRRARREREALERGKAVAQEDLLALADDIRALDLDIEMPGVDPAAKEDYGRAVTAYEHADRAYDAARRPDDLAAVSLALAEGRFAMESAKARLAGREPPERRPPCFFDPRHGPSLRDVLWAPPGGEPRQVPACAADATRIEEGGDPEQREVVVGGERTPYWAVPGLSPYAGGFFGGFGGLFPGILVGAALGDAFFPEPTYAQSVDTGDVGDFGGDVLGGDFGGGDFGGGGGGDFGGGGGDF